MTADFQDFKPVFDWGALVLNGETAVIRVF
jgi:hypothetical protein